MTKAGKARDRDFVQWLRRRQSVLAPIVVLLVVLGNIFMFVAMSGKIWSRHMERPDTDHPEAAADQRGVKSTGPNENEAASLPDGSPFGYQRTGCTSNQWADLAGAPPCDDDPFAEQQGAAKVALMFLVRDQLPTEPLWTAFLTSAAELKLRQHVPPTRPQPRPSLPSPLAPLDEELRSSCWRWGGAVSDISVDKHKPFAGRAPQKISNVTSWLQRTCGVELTGRQVYELQDLFTIYLHREDNAADFPKESVFYGRDIVQRIHAGFAQPSLVTAAFLLMRAALKDPRNSMFVLLSEACTPLHHPALVWAQLISESHVSRVKNDPADMYRWSPKMTSRFLSYSQFRKGTQWFSLTRMHAELALQDRHVWPIFEAYCRTLRSCAQENSYCGHLCVADEHYFATMLQVYGQDNLTSKTGKITYSTWQWGTWHPVAFGPDDVVEKLEQLRSSETNDHCSERRRVALKSAVSLFNRDAQCRAHGRVPLQAYFVSKVQDFFYPQGGSSRRSKGKRQKRQKKSLHYPVEIESQGVQCPAPEPVVLAPVVGIMGRKLQSSYWGGLAGMGGSSHSQHGSDSWGGLLNTQSAQRRGSSGDSERAEGGSGHRLDRTTLEQLQTRRMDMWNAHMLHNNEQLQREWESQLLNATRARLRKDKWLADYEPMPVSCPLFGRKLLPEAVSDFAKAAWACDGLGFAWECLV